MGPHNMGRSGSICYTSTMLRLTPKQRAYLRSLANPLKPIAQVGAGGTSAAALKSVREAFNTRELLKVRVLDSAPGDVRATAERIAAGLGDVVVVQTMGHVATLYRPFPKEPEIRLPER
jgi:RNA-binding protein